MSGQFEDTQNKAPLTTQKNKIGLPLIALGLDLVPIFIGFLASFLGSRTMDLPNFLILCAVICPITGLILGILALSRMKKQIGDLGRAIAIFAVALPPSLVVLIIGFGIFTLAVLSSM